MCKEEVKKAFIEGKLPLRAADTIKSTINLIKEKRPDLETQFWEELGWQPEYYVKVCNHYYQTVSEEFEEVEEVEEEVPEEVTEVQEEEKKEEAEEKGKLLTLTQVEEMIEKKVAPEVSKAVSGKSIQEFEEEIEEYREEIKEKREKEIIGPRTVEIADVPTLQDILEKFDGLSVKDFDCSATHLIVFIKGYKGDQEETIELKIARNIAKIILANGIFSLLPPEYRIK